MNHTEDGLIGDMMTLPVKLEVQTRSEFNGLNTYRSLADAMAAAALDPTIWKISFSLINGERVRMRRYELTSGIYRFVYDPMDLKLNRDDG